MKTTLTLACFVLSLCYCGLAVSQDLPADIRVDQYLLEAKKALGTRNPQRALQAYGKIEALDTELPLEILFLYGRLQVENSTALNDVRKGHVLLKQFVVNIEKDSKRYRPTLELLSMAEKKIERAERRRAEKASQQVEEEQQKADQRQAEAKRQAAAQERATRLKELLPSLLENLKQQMVTVQGGTFTMGCTEEQSSCDDDEKPVRQVQVNSFRISKYQVTQDLWEAVMGKNPSRFGNCPQCPVENVSWEDVQRFLKALNELKDERYRLPTEAKWEYAARGGQKSSGYLYAGSDNVALVAWHRDNSRSKTQPVGQKQPNELGLYDMSGNVWEWVEDCWSKSYKGVPTDGSAWQGGDCSRYVLRGGSWNNKPWTLRSAFRYRDATGIQDNRNGFRLAQPVPPDS